MTTPPGSIKPTANDSPEEMDIDDTAVGVGDDAGKARPSVPSQGENPTGGLVHKGKGRIRGDDAVSWRVVLI